MAATGQSAKWATVEAALRTVVRTQRQRALRKLAGDRLGRRSRHAREVPDLLSLNGPDTSWCLQTSEEDTTHERRQRFVVHARDHLGQDNPRRESGTTNRHRAEAQQPTDAPVGTGHRLDRHTSYSGERRNEPPPFGANSYHLRNAGADGNALPI